MSSHNGWLKGAVLGLLGMLIGALLTAGIYKERIDQLVEWRQRIDQNVTIWDRQEAEQETKLRDHQERINRLEAEIFKR